MFDSVLRPSATPSPGSDVSVTPRFVWTNSDMGHSCSTAHDLSSLCGRVTESAACAKSPAAKIPEGWQPTSANGGELSATEQFGPISNVPGILPVKAAKTAFTGQCDADGCRRIQCMCHTRSHPFF